jgi:hypothetical protein
MLHWRVSSFAHKQRLCPSAWFQAQFIPHLLSVKPWKRKQNCMMIGQQIDPFKHPEIPLSESPGTWRRPIGGKRQTNIFQAQAAQTSKRESKGGFFAIRSYLSFLDIFGVF